ncbi:MAG TPA: response regulator, partial [Dehalococcoidia bacterium]|nr:response regulator [Dehalococcoidia bacterium]
QEAPLQRALRHGESVYAEEIRFEYPGGSARPTLVSAAPIYSAEGKITGAIAVIQDITPLEEAEKQRSEFLGMVSHELRSPLTAIKGASATALSSRRPLDANEAQEFFQIIDEHVDQLTNLVNNLLDLSRMEAGALSVNPEPADLLAVLEDAKTTFARSGGIHQVQIRLPENLPQVHADRRRVGQVLTNLIDNAAKFSPVTEPISLEVELSDTHVVVRVRDAGSGIARNQLPRLFKKFCQLHNGSSDSPPGSGLGLAICKGIIEAHGGRIWADSPGEGKGTTFSFSLPVSSGPPSSAVSRGSPVAQPQRAVHRSDRRPRVLAVDDAPRVLRFLRRLLDDAGYETIVTSDPTEAGKLVETVEPDLVLLDVMLPGATGFDLLQLIREFSPVPVIFLTARDSDEDVVRALKLGADDYVTKPFSSSELLARIDTAVRRKVLNGQTQAQSSFVLDDLKIDFVERRVTRDGQVIYLSSSEYKLLHQLATHAGRVLTHDQILHSVWGPHYANETELVRSLVRRLRRKLGDDGHQPRYVFNEPRVGYRMGKP